MKKYPDIDLENMGDLSQDRLERHFLMQLLKHEILTDEDGDYMIWKEKRISLTKNRTVVFKVGFNY